MARVAGVDLPRDKRGEVALTYIYGIGRSSARRVLAQANLDVNRRVREWSDEEVARIREVIERNLKVEGDLRREVTMSVKRLMDISSYRGLRHRKGLPVRGQRTHTNARTRKGPRRGVGIRKKTTGKNPTTGKRA
jgi:small subunit ribosomal protein S13